MAIKNLIVVAIFLLLTQAGCACPRRCCCDGSHSCPAPCPTAYAYTVDEGDVASPQGEPQVAATASVQVAQRLPLEFPMPPVPSHEDPLAR